jgi:hypothetical protein
MDNLLLHVVLLFAAAAQGIAVYAAFRTLHEVKESNERIAEMAARNEKMTAEVLLRVGARPMQ